MNHYRSKIFYGWWIVIGGALFSFVATIASFHAVSEFGEAIDDSLLAAAPSYSTPSSLSYALRLLSRLVDDLVIGIVAAPFIGMFLDRHGPRPLMLLGIAAATIGFLLITQVQNDWQKHAAMMVVTIGFSVTTGIVFFGTLGKWFVRRRVLVFAILAASPTAAGLLTLYSQTDLIEFFGWQTIAVASGISLCVVGIPVALIMRRKPEDFGSLPDGDASNPKLQYFLKQASAVRFRTVVRERAFWQINVAIGLSLALVSNQWIDPQSVGFFDTTIRELLLSGYAVVFVAVVGVLIVGLIGLRSKPIDLVLAMLAVIALSYAGITFVHLIDDLPFEYRLFALFSVGSGVAGTSLLLLQFAVLAEYFGTRRLGAVIGAAFGINAAMNLVFRIMSGFAIDVFSINTSAYNLITLTFGLVVFAVAAALILNLGSQSRVAARMRLARQRQ